ncbi:MAG: immunoglobulin domain-containing protein [Planctomycetes bacterium]|nr:immunoglobulin domain-containing protein [Planctomycetota bacterium]
MNRIGIIAASLVLWTTSANAQWYATSVLAVNNPQAGCQNCNQTWALGAPNGAAYSLGYFGSIELELGQPVIDRPGADLGVWEENHFFGGPPDEHANVYLSFDRVSWTLVGTVINNSASQLIDIAGKGVSGARYVRVVDTQHFSVACCPGFDLDAVTVIATQDCNSNGVLDIRDIVAGTSQDCNNNGVPDECELAGNDCNNNGVIDSCDISIGAADCNGNGIPDSCDISSGTSQDCDNNGIPDECEGGQGRALSFNGAGQFVNIPGRSTYSFGTGDFSVEMWANPAALAGDHRVLFCNLNVDNCQGALDNGGQFARMAFHGGGAAIFSPSLSWNLGQWYHLAWVRTAGTMRLYRNGQEVGSGPAAASSGNLTNLNFGYRTSNGNHPWNGQIDEVRIWNTSRSASQINANMNHSLVGNEAGLIGYWRFDEASGQVVTDGSVTANNGTLGADQNVAPNDPTRGSSTVPFLVDCNGNGIMDSCDIASGFSQDCNLNDIPDSCDIADGAADCNTNGIPDSCDIASGTSQDCNANAIPDSCETILGPTISQQPADQTACVGQPVTFEVTATGVGSISYQWRYGGMDISGATGSSFTINPVTQGSAGSYYVVVTDSCGFVTSTAATLTVNEGGACACADIATVRSMALGLPVKICNVVVSSTTDLVNSATQKSFYLQDATGGLAVFGANAEIDAVLAGIGEGNSIDLLGTTSQFQGRFQLVNPLTRVADHGFVGIPMPDAVTTADFQDSSPTAEFHEGRLVVLSCVKFLETGLFAGVRDYTVSADGGATTVIVRISTNALNLVGTSIPCGPVNLRGMFGQFDTTEPRDGRYELLLRSTADITVCSGSSDCNTNGVPDECDIASWKLRSTATAPSQREWHAMAYDSSRGLSILFGGEGATGPVNGETWQWNGSAWTQRLVAGPAARSRHAMVYDASRAVVVLFGGWDGTNIFGDTWEWDGLNWAQRSNTGPSPRFLHGMAYDSIRQVSVLFGGYDSGTYNGETWEWNGTSWTLRSSTGPSSRYGHGMSYDLGRGTTVLFGGAEAPNGSFSGQTWEWNGGSWTLRSSTGPSPRYGVAMAYNQGRGLTMLSGGYTGVYNRETWEWNGNRWLLRSSGGPSPRLYHAMDYDAGRGMMVLFGGQTGTPTYYNNETWEFADAATSPDCNADGVPDECEQGGQDCNGNNVLDACDIASGSSQDCNSNGVPDSCELAGNDCNGNGVPDSCELAGQDCNSNGILDSCELKANDCNENGILDACDIADGTSQDCDEDGLLDECEIVAGAADCNANGVPDTCELAGQDCNNNGVPDECDIANPGMPWTLVSTAGPSPRARHATAYDSGRDVIVLFGGEDNSHTYLNDTWEWNGTDWSLRATTGPSVRGDHKLAYDSARGVTVLFGGALGESPLGDTWEWDGTSWALRTTSGPPARREYGLAYDSARGVTVMIGGSLPVSEGMKTWEWDGNIWTLRSSGAPAPAVTTTDMAFDAARGVCVLFGGWDGNFNGETWEWNGIAWTLRSSTGPSPRYLPRLAYDSARHVTVLYGGVSAGGGPFDMGTWEWDGAAWIMRTSNPPSPNRMASLSYDSARAETVLFGGGISETWVYSPATASQDCNQNGIPDSCDIASGASQDCNANSVPDDCEVVPTGNWTLLAENGPSARRDHAMAFDSFRDRGVLFGGMDSERRGDTWEWDSTTWQLRSTTGPSPRTDHAMAYDSNRHVTILFGGYDGNFNGQTWEWDGTSWALRSSSGPSPRAGHAMAYDAVRGVTVLFGGLGNQLNGETWEWDGTSWTLRSTNGPSPRSDHAMAYDSVHGQVVLFGGYDGANKGDSWTWDGSTWTLRSTTGPGKRSEHTLVFDTTHGVVVLFGGIDNPTKYGDTWTWNGTTWRSITAAGPSARFDHAMTFDAARGTVLLNGGFDTALSRETWGYAPATSSQDCNGNGTPDSCDIASGFSQDCNQNSIPDSCELAGNDCDNNGVPDSCDLANGTSPDCNTNGILDACEAPVTSWTQRSSTGPSPREWHAVAYDSARGVTVLFGGEGTAGPANGETWEWDGNNWILRSTTGPAPRSRHTMVYDGARGVCVLFGGWNGASYFADTWEWNGSAWSLRATSGPSPRFLQGMAYDSARDMTVLFGGAIYGGSGIVYYGETWEWNGTTWTLRPNAPGAEPSARYSPVVAYDVGRGVTVLFGGEQANGNGSSRETWEWNGAAWTLRSTSGPAAGYAGAMVYDASRGVEVMFGNYTGVYNAQTWEWDDGVWTLRSSSGPSPRLLHAMAYDSGRSRLVMFGGQLNSMPPYDGETWELTSTDLLTISGHPGSLELCAGGSATFSVTAAGPSLSYQWRKNGVPIANETGASVTINPVAASDAGRYDCVVTSPCGSVTSLPGYLTVTNPIPAAHYGLATYCPSATITSPYLFGITDDGPVPNSCWGQKSSRIFAGVFNEANGKIWRVRQTCVSQQFGPTLCAPESVLVDREARWQSLCTTPNLLIVGGCNTVFFINPSSGTVCEKFLDPTFNHIGQMALDSMGRLFVGSVDGESLNVVEKGVVQPIYTAPGLSPRAVSVDAVDDIYITCAADGVMRKLAPDGTVLNAAFATGLTGAASQAIAPQGIFHGNMYVACGDRVMEVNLATGESSLFLPCQEAAGIAFDPDGFMNISAPSQNRMMKIGSSLPGDMNGDGAVTLADVAGFAAALMLQPNAPLPTITADMNSDGCLSGLDIQLFVNTVLP